MRGELTKEVQKIAKKMIGRELISEDELRLIPYIQYIMVNDQAIDPSKLNYDDRLILSSWREEKFIEGGLRGIAITKEFWDFMCEILFESYVMRGGESE